MPNARALLWLVCFGSASAQEPLTLREMGMFFVGGEVREAAGFEQHVDQALVHYLVPESRPGTHVAADVADGRFAVSVPADLGAQVRNVGIDGSLIGHSAMSRVCALTAPPVQSSADTTHS